MKVGGVLCSLYGLGPATQGLQVHYLPMAFRKIEANFNMGSSSSSSLDGDRRALHSGHAAPTPKKRARPSSPLEGTAPFVPSRSPTLTQPPDAPPPCRHVLWIQKSHRLLPMERTGWVVAQI